MNHQDSPSMMNFKAKVQKYSAVKNSLKNLGLDLRGEGQVFDTTLPATIRDHVTYIDIEALPSPLENSAIAQYLDTGRSERITNFNREQKAARDWHSRPR